MTLSDIAARITGDGSMAKSQAAAPAQHAMRLLGLLTTSTRGAGGEMGTTSTTGYPPNGSSHITIASRELAAATASPT
jgi:hypothetical protein